MTWLSAMHTDTPLRPMPPRPRPLQDMWLILTREYYSVTKRNEILIDRHQHMDKWKNEKVKNGKNWKNEIKPDQKRTNIVWFHLYGASRVDNFIEKEGGWNVSTHCSEGKWELKWSEVKVAQSCPTHCSCMGCPWNSPGQNSRVGSLCLLQGIFLTQGSNPGLLHLRQIFYQLNHKEKWEVTAYWLQSFYWGW